MGSIAAVYLGHMLSEFLRVSIYTEGRMKYWRLKSTIPGKLSLGTSKFKTRTPTHHSDARTAAQMYRAAYKLACHRQSYEQIQTWGRRKEGKISLQRYVTSAFPSPSPETYEFDYDKVNCMECTTELIIPVF